MQLSPQTTSKGIWTTSFNFLDVNLPNVKAINNIMPPEDGVNNIQIDVGNDATYTIILGMSITIILENQAKDVTNAFKPEKCSICFL